MSKGVWVVAGGTINIPGAAGGLYHAGCEHADGWHDATEAPEQVDK